MWQRGACRRPCARCAIHWGTGQRYVTLYFLSRPLLSAVAGTTQDCDGGGSGGGSAASSSSLLLLP